MFHARTSKELLLLANQFEKAKELAADYVHRSGWEVLRAPPNASPVVRLHRSPARQSLVTAATTDPTSISLEVLTAEKQSVGWGFTVVVEREDHLLAQQMIQDRYGLSVHFVPDKKIRDLGHLRRLLRRVGYSNRKIRRLRLSVMRRLGMRQLPVSLRCHALGYAAAFPSERKVFVEKGHGEGSEMIAAMFVIQADDGHPKGWSFHQRATLTYVYDEKGALVYEMPTDLVHAHMEGSRTLSDASWIALFRWRDYVENGVSPYPPERSPR